MTWRSRRPAGPLLRLVVLAIGAIAAVAAGALLVQPSLAERGGGRAVLVGGSAVLRNFGAIRPPARKAEPASVAGARAGVQASGVRVAVTGGASPAPLTPLWQRSLGSPVLGAPAMDRTRIYVGARDGKVRALDRATGQILWQFDTGGPVDASPTLAAGQLLVASLGGTLTSLDSGGGLQWQIQTGGRNAAPPLVVDNLAIVGVGAPVNALIAVRLADGQVVWRHPAGQPVMAAPQRSGETLVAGANSGRFLGLSLRTGAVRWSFATAGGVRAAGPAVDPETTYVIAGDHDPYLYALRTRDGVERWRLAVGGDYVSTPVAVRGTVYVQSGDFQERVASLFSAPHRQRLWVVDAATGRARWQADLGTLPGEGVSPTPVVAANRVYAATGDGAVIVLDAVAGQVLARVDGPAPIVGGLAVEPGALIVVADLAGTVSAWRE